MRKTSESISAAIILASITLSFCSQINAKMYQLDNIKKEGVVPDVIDKTPDATISIKYNSGLQVEQGKELKPRQVKDQPEITYAAYSDQLYTLAMVDPDAPSRKDPKLREVLHFLVANIPGNQVGKGDVLAEYIGAGAPEGTGLHRYVYLLFKQSKGNLKSELKISNTSRNGRVNFSIRKFAKENNLGEPIAMNFFQAQFDDYVPVLHAQLSKG